MYFSFDQLEARRCAAMKIGEELGFALAAGGRTSGREGEVGLGKNWALPLCFGFVDARSYLGFKCSFSCLYTRGPTFSRPVVMGQVNNSGGM
jgi:hypothetical protein